MLLTAEQILKADDRPTEEVEVPEWGGSVLVRGLDGEGRDEYFGSMAEYRQAGRPPVMNTSNATAKLVARCIIGEDGEPMFTQSDVAALGKKSGAALDRVFSVAQRLSGLTEEDMRDLGKGSVPTLNGGSTSGSRRTSGSRSPNS
jgi:hypothetical protein